MSSDIPEFGVALERLQRLLSGQGYPTALRWVFRDDLYMASPTVAMLRHPAPAENRALAEKVFVEGRRSGLVERDSYRKSGDSSGSHRLVPQSATRRSWRGGAAD